MCDSRLTGAVSPNTSEPNELDTAQSRTNQQKVRDRLTTLCRDALLSPPPHAHGSLIAALAITIT